MSKIDATAADPVPSEDTAPSTEDVSMNENTEAPTAPTGRRVDRAGYRRTLQWQGMTILKGGKGRVPKAVDEVIQSVDTRPAPQQGANESVLVRLSEEFDVMVTDGILEVDVGLFFKAHFFNKLPDNILNHGGLMKKFFVPIRYPDSTNNEVSSPTPDMLLGYNSDCFLANKGFDELENWDQNHVKFAFLRIEFKGDGVASHGRSWTATNQLLVATSTCVNLMRRLCHAVRAREEPTPAKHQSKSKESLHLSKTLDLVVFGLIINGSDARLFATFTDKDGGFKMKWIRSFLLCDKDHLARLEMSIKAIYKWAEKRLERIKAALELIATVRLPKAIHTIDPPNGGPPAKKARLAK